MTEKIRYKRRTKLVNRRLQLRMIGAFVGMSALAFVLQYLLLGMRLVQAANHLPNGGEQMLEILPGALIEALLFSFGLLLPLIFVLGVLVTFRVAGPLHRMQMHLERIAHGESVEPLRFRSEDDSEMHRLAEKLNAAVEALSERRADENAATADPLKKAG